MNERTNQTLGVYVKARRLEQGLEVSTVAERSGLHHSYWRKLEAGHYRHPGAGTLRCVAEAIDCPVQDLYALCDVLVPEELPSLGPYLRATTDLSDRDVAVMESVFASLRQGSEGGQG